MKDISLVKLVEKNVEDEYAMNVLYYTVKKQFISNNFSLQNVTHFYIDGRFFGDTIKVSSNGNYRTPVHALSLMLSIRLLMLNNQCVIMCDDDNLIFVSKPKGSFEWLNYTCSIMDNWDDPEIRMVYEMMEEFYYDEEFQEEKKEKFKKSIVTPEFRSERAYYQNKAEETNGVSETVIGNNAFLEAPIVNYKVEKDIAYVGNTAFSYCEKLETLEFEGKVMFGSFPIIECPNLKGIIVPRELLDYYKNISGAIIFN